MPEFSKPLGAPLGPPTLQNVSTPYAPWAPLPGVNLIDNLPSAPNASVPGVLDFLGLQVRQAAGIACFPSHLLPSGGHPTGERGRLYHRRARQRVVHRCDVDLAGARVVVGARLLRALRRGL